MMLVGAPIFAAWVVLDILLSFEPRWVHGSIPDVVVTLIGLGSGFLAFLGWEVAGFRRSRG